MLLFEWDPEKSQHNQKKHGISFNEASTVFADPLSVTIHDPLHSDNEERFIILGISHHSKTLVVVHTERKETIRIISARKATKKERLCYENNSQQY
jgi:uncharacterized DUF497 family protein